MAIAEGSARESLKWRIWRWVKIVFAALVILYFAAAFWRVPYLAEEERSAKVAQEIQNAHITMADVDGSHLPPEPDPKLVDTTVEGIDANQNGIRDDVELAIFKKYPGASNLKLRAAELQYARDKELFLTNVFSSETLVAAINQDSRGYSCIGKVIPSPDINANESEWKKYDQQIKAWRNEVEAWISNTAARKQKLEEIFSKYMTSYELTNEESCDLVI